MAKHRVLEGENIFDVAVKLYGDVVSGVQDLLQLNPSIDMNTDLAGLDLEYNPSKEKRKKPVFVITVPEVKAYTYRTLEFQTVYDLAVQLYGNMSFIGKILKTFSNLNTEIAVGSTIQVDKTTDPVVQFFQRFQLAVATLQVADGLPAVPAGVRLLEDGTYRLMEDGTYRIIE
jgi:hypothetical protein